MRSRVLHFQKLASRQEKREKKHKKITSTCPVTLIKKIKGLKVPSKGHGAVALNSLMKLNEKQRKAATDLSKPAKCPKTHTQTLCQRQCELPMMPGIPSWEPTER